MTQSLRQGIIFAVLAYSMWGLAPIYFKLLEQIPSLEILIHRIVWSSLFLAIIIAVKKQWPTIVSVVKSKRKMAILTTSSALLGFNWWLFIWAVNNGQILEASLGYYINPLLNVALGMVFLSERLSKLQYAAVALAATGVLVQVVSFGSVPIVALGLASSFAIYGLIRKKVSVDSLSGLLIESLILILPALVYWWGFAESDYSNMANNEWTINVLLLSASFVTTLPLLCFVAAARRLNYSTLGFFQYIGPSIMFCFAVFVYGETVGEDRWVTFGFIWGALALYSFVSLRNLNKRNSSKSSTKET